MNSINIYMYMYRGRRKKGYSDSSAGAPLGPSSMRSVLLVVLHLAWGRAAQDATDGSDLGHIKLLDMENYRGWIDAEVCRCCAAP